jgi:hypothetical protein
MDYPSLASLSVLPDHLIKASAFNGCNNIVDCLKGLAAGMIYDNENFYVFQDYSQGKRIPAQIFVKGSPVDINYLYSLNVTDVESVEIFTKDELGLVNSTYNTNGAHLSERISACKNVLPATLYWPQGQSAGKGGFTQYHLLEP